MSGLPIALTLIGGPSILIDIAGFRLLTDPTFDDPGSYKLPHVTLQKLLGPAIAATELGRIDAVLLSHDQHQDNLDHKGRALLDKIPIVLTTKAGAGRLGGAAHGLEAWEMTELTAAGGQRIFVTATPVRHGPAGIEPLSGDVVGFLIGVDEAGDAVYVTGDTVWYNGVAEVARRYRPRLVILFAGSAKTRGSFHLTMDSNDAIETAHAFPKARIVAIHNDGWAHFTESRDQLEAAFATLGLAERLVRLNAGAAVALQL